MILIMLTASLAAQEKEIIFEDKFEGQLKDGWTWKRVNPKGYRFVRNTLEILMEPFADKETRNVLSRQAPNRKLGTYQIELQIDTPTPFENQYQQVGIFWTQGENVIFKFVREMIDGDIYIFPGKKQNTIGRQPIPACTTCLLIITFYIFWHIIMNYKSNIRFVYPHSKRVCCNNY